MGTRRLRSMRCVRIVRAAVAPALLVLALASGAGAQTREWRDWCGADAALGWHFYCDAARETQPSASPEGAAPAPGAADADPPPESATARIAAMRRALEESRAKAILDPTPANVAAYLHRQQAALQRAAAFSDAFRRTVWAEPALDYTLVRPVGALAKRLWSDARRAERAAALERLGERYGLIYLGAGGCGGCRVFGPLLRAFALRHRLDVLAVSMDGAALEGWPEAVPEAGRAARLGLAGAPLPAVVLFDTANRQVRPVAFGVVAEDQLAERLHVLTATEVGHDY